MCCIWRLLNGDYVYRLLGCDSIVLEILWLIGRTCASIFSVELCGSRLFRTSVNFYETSLTSQRASNFSNKSVSNESCYVSVNCRLAVWGFSLLAIASVSRHDETGTAIWSFGAVTGWATHLDITFY